MEKVTRQADEGLQVTLQTRASLQGAAGDIATLIGHVRNIAGTTQSQSHQVRHVALRIAEIADGSGHQLDYARRLAAESARVRDETHGLLTEVGQLRFEGHRRARELVESALATWRLEALDGADLESRLTALCRSQSAFELLYVTDAHGMQVTGNVAAGAIDGSARGRDWSERRWYKDVIRSRQTFVSDIYRSLATDDFCFTVSAPLLDRAGKLMGVLGADVRFDRILKL
jgi:methyl-accepting chemotaxis protein